MNHTSASMGTDPNRTSSSGITVIIGGVAGGMSAATRLRRLDENATIIVFEASGYISFANCGLPYYVGEVISARDELLLQSPEGLGQRFALDIRVGHTVTAINQDKTVTVRRPDGTEFIQAFDNLIMSPGASPRPLAIPGAERALALRTIEDVDLLHQAAHQVRANTAAPEAVIIGAGFIGLEVAENLRGLGFGVTIINREPMVMAPLDPEMAAYIEDTLAQHGVTVMANRTVAEITDTAVLTDAGEQLAADLVVTAAGVVPRVELARAAGIAIGPHGGIIVDEQQRTSVPYIYAVGDACEKTDINSQAAALIPLAQTANHHARIAADAIVGGGASAPTTLGTAIIGIFDQVAAMVGWNERRARAAGKEVVVIHTHPLNHVSYYPGAESMHMKLVVDASSDAILGAQIVGGAGVDKRIDIIATAMRAGLRAQDLADLELAYAPQFGAAKDPVNMLGFVYGNIRDGERTIQWHEVADSGLVLIDVRSPEEFAAGNIPGAINIPVDELRDRLDEIPAGPVIVHCAVGVRGHTAAALLRHYGYDARNLDGGYATWRIGQRVGQREG